MSVKFKNFSSSSLEIIKKGGDKRRSVLFSAVSKTYLWIDDMIRSNKIASRNLKKTLMQNSVIDPFDWFNWRARKHIELIGT